MQESLKLIQVPDVDTSRLSSVGDFRKLVKRIEQNWNINLEFNDNARWRPGSYERLKGQVTKALFPHWATPKGANTIRRLTKNSHYNCSQLSNDLILIDDKLRKFRQANESLDETKAVEEGNVLLYEYMENLTTPSNGVIIDISPLPYWSRRRRSSHVGPNEIFEPNWDNPLHPAIDRDGNIIKYNTLASTINKRIKIYSENRNPKRWFINVIIPLQDININYFNRDDKNASIVNHYGDLVVCFTIPLHDAILNYRIIKSLGKGHLNTDHVERQLDCKYYSGHTLKFPYVSSIQHPFVHSGSSYYTYQWGNTCFGGYRGDVAIALATGMMGHLKVILDEWSQTYYLGNTSPLNQPESHHLGMPKEWKNNVLSAIGTNTELCRFAVDGGMKESYLLQNFCTNCQLTEVTGTRNICDYYLHLTTEPIVMPTNLKVKLEDLIEHKGLPGQEESGHPKVRNKAVVQDMTEKLWNFCISKSHCDENDICTLYKCYDHGSGNLDWGTFHDTVINFKQNMLAPEEEMDCEGLARDAYLIFRYCERIYWLGSIASYDEHLWDELANDYYLALDKAEEVYPISNYRMMVNTYRVTTNQPLYPEYYLLLLDELNSSQQGGSNERQPF